MDKKYLFRNVRYGEYNTDYKNNDQYLFWSEYTKNFTDRCRIFENVSDILTDKDLKNLIHYSDTKLMSNMSYFFNICNLLTSIPLLDTSKVTDMQGMFYDCSSLTSIPLLDTSKVTDMNNMFHGCRSLTSIPPLDTSKVTDISYMFYSCSSLISVPQLDTSKVTDMSYMFYSCSKLKQVELTEIHCDLDLSDCTQLEKQYVRKMVNHLVGSEELHTLKLGSLKSYISQDEIDNIKITKNWDII